MVKNTYKLVALSQSASRSVCQWQRVWPVQPSVCQSPRQTFPKFVYQPVSESVSQWVSELVSQSACQSVSRPVSQLGTWLVGQPVNCYDVKS